MCAMGALALSSAVASQTVEVRPAAEEPFRVFTDSSLPAGQSSESEVPWERGSAEQTDLHGCTES